MTILKKRRRERYNVRDDDGGDEGIRTLDLSDANRTLSHTGRFLVTLLRAKLAQSVIFQGLRPFFVCVFDMLLRWDKMEITIG